MQEALIQRLRSAVGHEHVTARPDDLRNYAYDGSIDRAAPEAVVFPADAAQVAAVVRACEELRCPYVARGAGTGLSGGAIAEFGGVLISTARMRRILDIDAANRTALVEPGVVNAHISAAVATLGLRFVPDPSSQSACTIGGNVAENAGGLHCLAYGVTSNHVLGCEIVTPQGEIVWLGGRENETAGYDLLGVFIGSEGTLGIATKIAVKLTPQPETTRTLLAVFDSVDDASKAVSDIIAAGIIPAALEMMDRLSTQAIEAYVHAGFPTDAGAILIADVDGLQESVGETAAAIGDVCRRDGAREVRLAKDEAERERIWRGRKSAFGAMGRFSPSYYVQDGVIPRTKLPEVLAEVEAIGRRYGLLIANVFHAGDGNIHPLIAFDEKVPAQVDAAIAAGADILRACVARGGSISGEHGIGIEKRDCMNVQYAPSDLALMAKLKAVFNPGGLCNPAKMFPTSRRCGESARTLQRADLPEGIAPAAGPAF
ncbi:MAG: FAD-binding oxidoreductase [Candidatus Eremiobacter antarcticus]|nr:FAD-binding protein [Candidatus Eremiobacteraeota bacterium]MBC5806998.1 FAD-binding protein [Candidatus Eremiobacteraeota bacterium]PZR62868.1 MAG: FAD-binding oxidoreductase [Candidatus Eremiobacter sp. RRmetagenome_bin22]